MSRRQITYNVVYMIVLSSSGISSDLDATYADTPEEVGAAVTAMLLRAKSFQSITVRERQIPA